MPLATENSVAGMTGWLSSEPMNVGEEHHLTGHLEKVLFGKEEIESRVAAMGSEITNAFAGESLVVIAVLQGGILFLADLIRRVNLPLQIDSISVASYHGGTSSSGTVTFHQNYLPDVSGKHVLVLDDILDTGRTLSAITSKLKEETSPLSVCTAVLLSKQVDRDVAFEADYVGFEVGNEFVVGYGLDYDGRYRNLPMIGVLKPEHI